MENKWTMFKNYMHNELGITKEDIRGWIEEAAIQQAEKMVKHEFSSFDVERTVKKMVMDDRYFGSEGLKKEVTYEVARQIVDKMELSIKK